MELQELITVREVLRLVLLSSCLTVASGLVFPRNSLSRRSFMTLFVVVLPCMPWLAGGERWVWELGLEEPPRWSLGIPVPEYLLLVWWLVALLLVLAALLHVRRVHHQILELPVVDAERPRNLVEQLAKRLGLERPVVLRVGMAPCSSTLVGTALAPWATIFRRPATIFRGKAATIFRRPATIILPAEHVSWSHDSLSAVLAHELVHVYRRDDQWMLLVRLVSLWYWWMPWLRWLYGRYVGAIEESCDDRASELCDPGLGYLDGVVAAADARASTARMPYLPHLGEHPLVARVARFAGAREQELDTRGIYWVALTMLGTVSLLASVKPVALPQASPVAARSVHVVPLPGTPAEASTKATFPVVRSSLWLPNEVERSVLKRISEPAYEPLPVYPGMALRRGIDGDVLVEYSVTIDGAVSQAKVIRATPPGVFDTAALRAVKQTKYVPIHTSSVADIIHNYGTGPPGKALRVQKEFQFRISAQ